MFKGDLLDYGFGVLSHAEMRQSTLQFLQKGCAMGKKKAAKVADKLIKHHNRDVSEFLHAEIVRLETMTVNPKSEELMKRAAPETYAMMRAYLTRRLAECGVDLR